MCRRCGLGPHDFSTLPRREYAYLLGAYLGDGTVARNTTSHLLRVSLDAAYPGIIREVQAATEAVCGRPAHAYPASDGLNWVNVTSYWKSWPCLLPQHGPGRKHSRKIELADWQQEIVDAEPGAFLRGLIHTDGWRGVNEVHVKGRDYEHPRYQFSNRSDDIRGLFTQTCDRLGVEWRRWGRRHISVAKRDSVALLDRFVGLKA
jgi:hypothetical protein